MRTILLALAWFLSAALAARPAMAASAGAESFDFLLLDANARPAGLGGAYSALAQDANALQYNPAGLAGVCRSEATFMHNQYFESITQEYVGIALKEGLGFSLNYLDFGSVPQTTISSPFGTGSRVGMSDLAVGLGYGRSVARNLSAGVGVKFLKEAIAGYSASGFAAELGLQYRPLERLSLGASLQNVGPKIKFQSRKEALSRVMRLGAAYRTGVRDTPLLFALDVIKERSEAFNVAFGVEATLFKKLALRFGYNTRNDAGPGFTMGMGWQEDRWSVDYAFVPFGDLGSANRMSVSWRFDNGCNPAAAVASAPPPPPAPVPVVEPPAVPAPVVEVAPLPPPVVSEVKPALSPAETQAQSRLGGLAVPGSVTAPIIAAVLGAAGDPSCPWEREGVLCMRLATEFEYDKADLKGDFAVQLQEIATFLQANPKAVIDLQGHTDNKGGMDHNIRLSRGRARSVKKHLVTVNAVDASRLTSQGLGFAKPTASNDTDEGRQRNRRVMAILEWK